VQQLVVVEAQERRIFEARFAAVRPMVNVMHVDKALAIAAARKGAASIASPERPS
jgi:hypothetical protein